MDKEIKKYLEPGRKNFMVIYVLFLCGIVNPLLSTIGLISAYVNYKNSQDNKFFSHYIFIFRTFIMSLIFTIVAFIINLAITKIFTANNTFVFIATGIEGTLFCIWYIFRIAIGFKYLLNNSAHPNYMTYWIK